MTGKGPLNYTTTIDPQKTMSECIAILARHGATAIATLAQARRTSWRVVRMWLEAQLALIEAGLVDLPQVMLPFMIDDEGRTVYQRFLEREQLALTAGGAS